MVIARPRTATRRSAPSEMAAMRNSKRRFSVWGRRSMSIPCLIAQAAHGLDQHRVLRVVLKLFAQALDIDGKGVVVDEILVHIPDLGQDLGAGEDPSLVEDQSEQQPIFQCG